MSEDLFNLVNFICTDSSELIFDFDKYEICYDNYVMCPALSKLPTKPKSYFWVESQHLNVVLAESLEYKILYFQSKFILNDIKKNICTIISLQEMIDKVQEWKLRIKKMRKFE